METILKNNKLQIFIFRSRNQQFVDWNNDIQKWCEQYKDYFTIIDDDEGQIEHNIFKVMKISDFKNPLYLDNKKIHEGVGLLNIANNLDQFDYQYIGFIHMDMFPLIFNLAYQKYNFDRGYPIQPNDLFDLSSIFPFLEKEETLFSFSLLKALTALNWHLQDFSIVINKPQQSIWQFLIKKFNLQDPMINKTDQQIQNLKFPIACSFLAKKSYWKKLQPFIDNLSQMQDLEKYGNKILDCKCDKDIIISQMLQAFVELTILEYITQNNIPLRLIPICHFN